MSVRLAVTGSLAVATLVLAGCASSGGSGPKTSSPTGATVSLQGSTLVAADGHTLYENTVDTATAIKCAGGCQSLWPPVPGPANARSGVSAAALGTATRPDGSVQTTLNGHPLYEFSGDKAAGDKRGNGIADGGGVWHVATVGGSTAPSTPVPSTSSSSSSGGGYTY